jgi:hypothetical protein
VAGTGQDGLEILEIVYNIYSILKEESPGQHDRDGDTDGKETGVGREGLLQKKKKKTSSCRTHRPANAKYSFEGLPQKLPRIFTEFKKIAEIVRL